MKLPSLPEINDVRKGGFRPQVVGCFVNTEEKKVFLFFDEKYKLWQFPQGGIENGEEAIQALDREMREELGGEFVQEAKLENSKFLGQRSLNFPQKKHGSRELNDDEGNRMLMKGKWYYFFAIKTEKSNFDEYLENSEFHGWKMLGYEEAVDLARTIYQKGKKEMTIHVLNILKENAFIE